MQGVRQRHRFETLTHSVPACEQVPSHAGAPPPEHVGGRQNAGMPGAGPTQLQPSGQPSGHGDGGGPVKHAQFEICTSPQQVNVSRKHCVPAGQSPSPQLG